MPHSTYYLSNDFALEVKKNYKAHKEITYDKEFDIFDNAIITLTKGWMSDGVFDKNIKLLTTSYKRDDIASPNLIPIKEIDINNIKHISETVIYGGILVGHFGSFITETFNRLWYLIKHKDQKYKIVFTHFKYYEYDLRPFHKEFIELLDIESERILIIDDPTRFEKVIVPKQSVYWDTSYNKLLLSIIYDYLINRVKPKNFEKLYISKSKVVESDSFTLNEEYFESFFESQGFKIIYPEQLSVYEQISYISGAKEIACTSGTLSHLVLFSKRETKLICLIRSNLDLYLAFINRQVIINIIKGINCIFVDVSLNFIPLLTIDSTHLIGPTTYWKDFLKNEYKLELDLDIFGYLDSTNFKLGRYIKGYANKINDYKWGYITYFLSMLRTYDSYSFNKNISNLYSHRAFAAKSFRFKKINENIFCIIRLDLDGYIKPIQGEVFDDVCHWLFLNEKLYFLNSNFKAVEEFIIRPIKTGTMIKRARYIGNSVPNPGVAYELIEIQHNLLRIIIKLIVNKKRYKKLKRDPINFFKDSKSKIIKFLGQFYF